MAGILTRAILDAQGLSERALAKELKKGSLRRIGQGAYTRTPKGTPWDEHRLLIEAVGVRGNAVISHQSAAVVHRMATYGVSLNTCT
ncbi:type IV toxin-antitoxin system AbiEi family antitoxin domain-containing protein [Tsukamurella sp. PLM1]|uniref:type IV toxin-antitoxin system AbiEi family antitoxin domain-containing protein n=1 Tax=Tsukamurella sp. PLM1 TaxID=2929795 RepID=UPI00205B0EC9|nr:type IV toxin-antitoxin system AbiEi family antitoxin domain-containing protein [Tsukamurella sp. PLM1]BDH58192.1 hypothetical protein MTP03_31310 [Tsukamurella sp. PLM1]